MTAQRGKRLALLALMALAAVNLFTGAPLLAIWVGSRVQGESGALSMTAVFVVVLVLALVCWALIWALNAMGDKHDELIGRPAGRRQSPWMKPFNSPSRQAPGTSLRALDRILVGAVVLAGLAFETWFFFFAGSSIGSN
jgi:hypothetical protein